MSASPDEFTFTRLPNGWVVGRFAALDGVEGVAHLVSTADSPDAQRFRDEPGRAGPEVAAALGVEGVAYLDQVHGADVLRVDAGGLAGRADAIITDRRGLALMGRSADCPLILLADRAGRVAGMAHASWRATVGRIAERTVARMRNELGADPAKLIACICPSAGACCYEVGPEVVAAAVASLGERARRFFPQRDGRTYFDLIAANTDQLVGAGVRRRSVTAASLCTICCRVDGRAVFPSYRREGGEAGRFVAAIALRHAAPGGVKAAWIREWG